MKTIKYEVTKYEDGREDWQVDGIFHREDGPAIKEANGSEYWYLNGKYHRKNGPAVLIKYETVFSIEEWRIDGKLHREDGPAIKWANGTEAWYKNGNLHREDGPAINWYDGKVEYWIDGKRINKKNFITLSKKSKSYDGKVIEIDGVKYKITTL